MKKVLMHGYVANNLGDDLFFEYVAKRYPDIQFDLCSTKNRVSTFIDIPNINVLYPSFIRLFFYRLINRLFKKKIQLYRVKRDYEFSLTVGGSIFIQNEDWKLVIKEYERKISDNKSLILGANFGPFEDKEFLEVYKKTFKKLEDLCFRDKYSYELFKNHSNVRYAPDILFGIKPLKIKEEKKVFVSVIKPSIRKSLVSFDREYYVGIYNLCEEFIKKEYMIVLSSFCRDEGDEEAIQCIYEMFDEKDKKYVEKVYYNGTNRNFILQEIASSEIVVATRFHAMILGWVYSKKVVPILYSDKMLHVIRDIKFNGVHIDIRNKEQSYKIDTKDIGVLQNINQLAKESSGHFKMFDQLIKKLY